jgi:hypothetical protein
MNFRLQGGVPSIQFSVSADAQFADIDVDYRSSQFPASLFNGHLSSANSDVRAGNNHDKHIGGWDGLEPWWSGWEGLGDWRAALVAARGGEPPPEPPRKGGGAAEVAVFDFLSSWLVEQQLDVALAYFSTEVNKCLSSDDENPTALTPRQRLTQNMALTNQVLGQPSRLADAIQGVHLGELELVAQTSNEYHQQFVLSSVPADRVVEFDCAFKGVSVPEAYRAALSRRGEYQLATFYLGTSQMRGATIALLWKREPDGWRVVSYELEPALGLVPDLRVQTRGVRTRETVPSDPDFVRSHEAFIDAWLVENDYDAALGFLTDTSRSCVDLFGDDGSNRTTLREGFESIAEFIGPIDHESLDEAIEGVTPSGLEFKVVEPQTNAYTLLSLPDALAESFDCTTPPEERTPISTRGDSVTGNYYASLFRLKVVGERPAPFFTVWAKQNNAWRIIAFELIAS